MAKKKNIIDDYELIDELFPEDENEDNQESVESSGENLYYDWKIIPLERIEK